MLSSPIKRLALRYLPDRWLTRLKKRHYLRKLRRVDANTEPEMAVLAGLLRPGMRAIDVGANFGSYTRCLSELVGPAGEVWSIEPVPMTFDVLRSGVESLEAGNVRLLHSAVSDAVGMVRMQVPVYPTGGENFYEARIVDSATPGLRTVEVPAVSLDRLCERMPHVDLVKVDVEGHEWAVVRGADALIRRCRPIWLVEISGNPDDDATNASKVFAFMAERGYRARLVRDGELIDRRAGDRSVNYFFVPTAIG